MNYKLQHILTRYTSILLLVVIIFPSVVKFAHIFEQHKHEVCINPSDSHFHELEIDCEFYKFKLTNSFSLVPDNFSIIEIVENHKKSTSQYFFISSFKSIGIALRGPPTTKYTFS